MESIPSHAQDLSSGLYPVYRGGYAKRSLGYAESLPIHGGSPGPPRTNTPPNSPENVPILPKGEYDPTWEWKETGGTRFSGEIGGAKRSLPSLTWSFGENFGGRKVTIGMRPLGVHPPFYGELSLGYGRSCVVSSSINSTGC